MKTTQRKKLAKAGWKVGTVAEFLDLTPEEEMLIEMKLAAAAKVKELRKKQSLSQAELAKRLGSSQPRVAKLEAAEAEVSLELMIRALVALGATAKDVGRLLGGIQLSQQAKPKRAAARKKSARKSVRD